MAFVTKYPPAHSSTYVKATTQYSYNLAYRGTDPSTSLIGYMDVNPGNGWQANGPATEQKFNIDLGEGVTVERIYLENSHINGTTVDRGIKNFLFYGTNSATAFANTTYSDTTGLTLLATLQAVEHSASNASDPQYFTVSNNDEYRYYVLRIADTWGGGYMGFRRIELQYDDSDPGYWMTMPEISGEAMTENLAWGSFSVPSVSVSGNAMTENFGAGEVMLPSIVVSGVADTENQSWGNIKCKKFSVSGVADTENMGWGDYSIKTLSVSGVAATENIGWGNFVSPMPKISSEAGLSDADGTYAMPMVSISGVAITENIAHGSYSMPMIKISGEVVGVQTFSPLSYLSDKVCN